MAIVAIPLIGSTTKSYVCLSYCNPTLQKGRIDSCLQGEGGIDIYLVSWGGGGGLHIFNLDGKVRQHGSAASQKQRGAAFSG
jgi:hypothetical protein